MKRLIKGFRITIKFKAVMLKLNFAGKGSFRSRTEHL